MNEDAWLVIGVAAFICLIATCFFFDAKLERDHPCLRAHVEDQPVIIGKGIFILPFPVCDDRRP